MVNLDDDDPIDATDIEPRVNLSGMNLRDADLSKAQLIDADLRDADLSKAQLIDANLRDADLSEAQLIDANLRDADLSEAQLIDADLVGANFHNSDLSDANLVGANFHNSDLSDANLRRADLSSADLNGANLSNTDLTDATLDETVLDFDVNKPEVTFASKELVSKQGAIVNQFAETATGTATNPNQARDPNLSEPMATVQRLQSLDPYEFEKLVAELWSKKGYKTNLRSKTGDKGIDIDAERAGISEKIQVKRYGQDNKLGSNEVRKYATIYQQTNANKVVIATSGEVTDPARELAENLSVEIHDGKELVQQLNSFQTGVSDHTGSSRSEDIQHPIKKRPSLLFVSMMLVGILFGGGSYGFSLVSPVGAILYAVGLICWGLTIYTVHQDRKYLRRMGQWNSSSLWLVGMLINPIIAGGLYIFYRSKNTRI